LQADGNPSLSRAGCGTVRRERLDAYFEPFGLTANVVLETGDRAAWPSLVRAGHGYALNYIDPDNAPPPGIVLESLEPPVLVEFTAIYRPGMDPAIEQLVDCLVG
jgi:DNA-binding transcriptional LysR family regulator